MAGMKTKSIRCIGLSILVLVSVLFCAGLIMANENEQEKKIFMMSDDGENAIVVNGAGEFAVRIKSNPTTGYSWAVEKIADEEMIKFKGIKTEEPGDRDARDASGQRMLGAPTYERLTFEALKPGKTEIKLKYRRPWEKDVPPIKTHKIIVTIEY